jgi:3-oxoadipate enol-lactonase
MQVFGDDGARVDVRVDGSGATAVVLIAGFLLTRDIWNAQAKALSQTHRAILPDLRGMGASGVSDGPYLMESLAADVAAALDALGIERAAIAGHSLGGYVALAFARMFTERVSHLALICSRLAADTPEQLRVRRELAARVARENNVSAAVEAYVPKMLSPETQRARPEITARVREIMEGTNPAGASAMLLGMGLRSPSEDIAPDLGVPVLVLAGRHDAVIPMEEARAVAESFPRARLVVCERSGHLPMLEEPERVSDAIAGLLSE